MNGGFVGSRNVASPFPGSPNGGSTGQGFLGGPLGGPVMSTSSNGFGRPSENLPAGPGGQLSNGIGTSPSGITLPSRSFGTGINGGSSQSSGFGPGFGGQLNTGVPVTGTGNVASPSENFIGANGLQMGSNGVNGLLQSGQTTGIPSSGGVGGPTSNIAGLGGGFGGQQLNAGVPSPGPVNGAGPNTNFIGGTGTQIGSGGVSGPHQPGQTAGFQTSGGGNVLGSSTGGFGGGFGGPSSVVTPGVGIGGTPNGNTVIGMGPQMPSSGGNVPAQVGPVPGFQVPSVGGSTQVPQQSSPQATTRKPETKHKKRKHKKRRRGRMGRIVIECSGGVCSRVER